jgi:hypothetical protein
MDYIPGEDAHFSLSPESVTKSNLIKIIQSAVDVVRAHPDDIDLYEGINLRLETVVEYPSWYDRYQILEDVRDVLLTSEDVVPVEGSLEKAKIAIRQWCDYLDYIVIELNKELR